MLSGKALYREIWYDKPPLVALFHLLSAARAGWLLRVWDALYAWTACAAAYLLARAAWSRREGLWAAGLMAFFLIFDFPATAIPAASDLLLVTPHLLAVWLAIRRRPVWCGIALGIGFWASPKALFIAPICLLWDLSGTLPIAVGFGAVALAGGAWLWAVGAWSAYWTQVWEWGRAYAASPFVANPLLNGVVRSANWLGFHAALVVAALIFLLKSPTRRWLWLAWTVLALAGACAGMRFFPRYYFLLLPPLLIMAARGFALIGRRAVWAAALLVIPLVRFAPDYSRALNPSAWRDIAMDRDSRSAAAIARSLARPGDTLFVWGYRPELYVYTGLPAATIYLDSQPLTGVPADRHLTQSEPIAWPSAPARREQLSASTPTFILDGLSLFNTALAPTAYPELRPWLARYREAARTGQTIIYALPPR
jgi:hypothetical protein